MITAAFLVSQETVIVTLQDETLIIQEPPKYLLNRFLSQHAHKSPIAFHT